MTTEFLLTFEKARTEAAFGVELVRLPDNPFGEMLWGTMLNDAIYNFSCARTSRRLYGVSVRENECANCEVVTNNGIWHFYGAKEKRRHARILAHGFYCLGLEPFQIKGLDYEFTAHEKLELRLSMPREFWPQTWLDEETPSPVLTTNGEA